MIAGGPKEGHGISFRYTSTDGPNPTAQCLPRMLRAGGVDELDEALRDWVDPSNNFVSIDVHGNIQYLNRGRLPVRSMANAWLPVPGWSDEYEWRGFVPFEEMLRSRNPDTGYIVTANNKIAGDDYPHYISLYYGSDGRARRILGKVRGLTGATVEDMADVHGDIVSIPGRTYAALLGDIEPEDATARRAVGMLADWDGSMHRDLVAPTVYSAFRRELDLRVLAPLLGPLSDEAFGATGRGAPRQVGHLSALLASHAAEGDTSMLPDGADWSSVATQALEAAVDYLRGRLGDDVDSWQWGRIHGTAPRHLLSDSFPGLAGLLDPPSTPMSGDGDTPHSASYNAATRSRSPARPSPGTSSTRPTGTTRAGSCRWAPPAIPAAATTPTRGQGGDDWCPCSWEAIEAGGDKAGAGRGRRSTETGVIVAWKHSFDTGSRGRTDAAGVGRGAGLRSSDQEVEFSQGYCPNVSGRLGGLSGDGWRGFSPRPNLFGNGGIR